MKLLLLLASYETASKFQEHNVTGPRKTGRAAENEVLLGSAAIDLSSGHA
jgi:hypothetical protein